MNLKFINQENKESNLYHRKIINLSDGTTFEIGLHPVIYGWRIRGGYIEEGNTHAMYYDIDLCAGDKAEYIALIYYSTLNLILKNLEREKGRQRISSFIPVFHIKPITNDPNFGSFLHQSTPGIEFRNENVEVLNISDEDLVTWREEFTNTLFCTR